MPVGRHHHRSSGAATRGDSEESALVRSTEGMSYTEEVVAINPMLHSSGSTTVIHKAGGGDEQANGHDDDLNDFVDSDISVLAQFHEDAIRQAGSGYFQWVMLVLVGLSLAADTVELFVIAYILPSAEVELCIDDAQKGWLAAITFIGMMMGGIVWGNLSDRMGRRRTLLSALSVNAVFSVIAAFMPTYGTFMTARFISAIGVGGSLPVVFAYLSEFLPKMERARYLSWLLMFWALGGVFVALMAWALIPRTGVNVIVENKEHFSAWHQFLLACCAPSLAGVVGVAWLPESPRYLLEAGREVEAMMVYQRIYKLNNKHNPAAHAQYQLSELELPSKRPTGGRGMNAPPSPGKSVLADMTYSIEMFWNSFLQLFMAPYLKITFMLLVLWFTAAFGYYGLSIWFPDYIKLLKTEKYSSRTKTIVGESYEGITFNRSFENTDWQGCNFTDCRFQNLILSHVTFDNSTLDDVTFSNIKFSKTYFRNSVIRDSRFTDTDLTEQRFLNCRLINNTILSLTDGCTLDFDYNIHLEEVFVENLVGMCAMLPGAFLSGFIMNSMGRVRIIGVSMFLSCACACFIWLLDSDMAIIIFEVVFNFIFIMGWNALDITTLESYPTHLRTTGFGLLSAGCRLGGIIGTVSFASFLNISRLVPMLTTAAALFVGGVVSLRLTETTGVLL